MPNGILELGNECRKHGWLCDSLSKQLHKLCECGHVVRSGLTTQAQRPGPRGRSIATWTRWPGSLQRMVRRIGGISHLVSPATQLRQSCKYRYHRSMADTRLYAYRRAAPTE